MSHFVSQLTAPESVVELLDVFNQSVDSAWLLYASNPRIAVVLLFTFLFAVYYIKEVAKKPDIFCKEGKLRSFIVGRCPQLQERYWPTFWCFGTHAQTALANTIRGTLPNLRYRRELIALPDGGQLSLDWYDAPRTTTDRFDDERRPIALFLPGLTGDSNTEYIKSLVPTAHNLGYRVVAFNNRGLSGVKLLTPRLYCAANCEDLRYVLGQLKSRYPKSQIVATGVSLGGILLCRYLIHAGDDALVDAAMLISVTFDFVEGSKSMSKPGLNMALNHHLTKSLCRIVREQKEVLEALKGINFDDVMKSKTLVEFDNNFTTKVFGFSSPLDYYKEASNIGKLHLIRRPTLCINAADDMFAPLHALPIEEAKESSHVCLVVTQRGGHIGFMEGLLPTLPFFSERLSKQYLGALITLDDIQRDLMQ